MTTKLVADISRKYQNCLEYSDKGNAFSINQQSKDKNSGSFSSKFKRNELFEFEWQSDESGIGITLTSNFKRTILTSSTGDKDDFESVESGIIALFGGTLGVTFIAPTLLMPSLMSKGKRVTDLEALVCSMSSEKSITIRGVFNDSDIYDLCFAETFELLSCDVHSTMSQAQAEALNATIAEILLQSDINIPNAVASSTMTRIIYSDAKFHL